MKQGWEIKKLGEVCEIVGGSTPKTKEPTYWNGEYYWATPADLNGSKYISSTMRTITDAGIKSAHLQLLPIGTVLLSSRAPIGKVAITTVPMYCNQGFKNLICGNTLNNGYAYWFLSYNTDYLNSIGTGATFKEISKTVVEQIPITIPPLSEQERIVAELDLLSDVIAKKREQLKQLDTLAQSIFYDMFGDPITNEKGWEQVSLVDICKNTGVYGAGSSSIPKQPHRPRYIRITDILDSGDLNDDFVVSSNIEDDHTYRLNVGDILFARSGATVGKTYLYRGKEAQIHAGYLIKFSLDILHVNPLFIFYITKNRSYKLWISNQIIGVAQPNINAQKYGKLPIILPPLPLQQQFASKIESIEKQNELIKQSLSEVQQLFDSRMDYYFG